MIDLEKNKRELIRWLILYTSNEARPYGAPEGLILSSIQAVPIQLTALELRQELDYLEGKGLITVSQKDSIQWYIKLTSVGVDVAEYVVPCPAGIARPPQYWV